MEFLRKLSYFMRFYEELIINRACYLVGALYSRAFINICETINLAVSRF